MQDEAGETAPAASVTANLSATIDRSPATTSSFAPNDLIAGRFRVVRFVARGGMGEVYEAEDLELRDRVALKTARLEIAKDDRFVERFRREIQLARKVTHPNVCRTFDVFRHVETREGSTRETMVVSMELLAGETLEQRIRRQGRFSEAEALPLIEQMAAGLNSAHEAGVVHRDFKSANVMLTSGLPSGGIRAVITDFGLAHADAFAGQTITGAHDLVGTPAYMAPEQLQGGEITPATDIYAFGVVLFEMLAGKLPFAGDSPLSTALKRLKEPAPSARTIIPDLDLKWDEAIRRCLEREPAHRFATTQDVVRVLGGEKAALLSASRIARTRRPLILAIAAVVVVAASIGLFVLRYRLHITGKRQVSVAVVGFKNMSDRNELNLWGDELAENLRSQLDSDEIRVVNPAKVDEMKRDLGIKEVPESLSPSLLAKIHEHLGCDVVVIGSYSPSGDENQRQMAWNIHLVSATTGDSLGTVPETVVGSDWLGVVRHAGKGVRTRLGVEVSDAEAGRIDAQGPKNADASKYFAQGRERLKNFDVRGASEMFQQAVNADPTFAEAHSALAEAWSRLGYDAKALDEAKKAFDLSPGLTEEKGELIKARYYEMRQDWDKAGVLYDSLWDLHHQIPEYGLLLARSQVSGNKSKEALASLAELQESKLPLGIEAQANLIEADAQSNLANYQEQFQAASAASDKAKSLNANLMLARARIPQCLALISLGEAAKAKPLCEEARSLNQAAGDQLGTARATNAIANGLYAHGDRSAALPLYQQALQIARAIGDKLDETGALNNIGMIDDAMGDPASAKRAYQQSIEVATQRGDKINLALTQQNLAGVLYEEGDRAGAGDLYGKAVQLAHEIGAKDTEARALNNICMLGDEMGDFARALDACRQSFALRKEIGDKGGMANSLQNIGDILENQGDLSGALQNYQQALDLQESIGAKGDAAYSQAGLAEIALRGGDAAGSRSKAEVAAEEFSKEKEPSGEAQARSILAEALLASGDMPGARSQIEQATKLAQQAGEQDVKLAVSIANAKIDAQSGRGEQALKALQAIQKNAHSAGFVRIEFEARLALGEAQMKAGKAANGRTTLKALAQEAKQKGFGYIAARASKQS